MKLEKMRIGGFRCFNIEAPATVSFNSLTTFIGKNGSGKTSALIALSKVFGISQYERVITKDDFYTEPGKDLQDYDSRTFFIDVTFALPELDDINEDDDAISIPEVFQHMSIGAPEAPLKCRIYFEGTWRKSSLPGGEIEHNIHWVHHTEQEVELNNNTTPLSVHDRSKIHVIYVPAHREPDHQLRDLSTSYMGQFMKAMKWSEGPQSTLKDAVKKAKRVISQEKGVSIINHVVDLHWKYMNDTTLLSNPKLNFLDDDINKMIAKAQIVFEPSTTGEDKNVESLSDGQKSLFYFSLLRTFFAIHSAISRQTKIKKKDPKEAFEVQKIKLPILTIFAIEEPENHLSPHYIGKIIKSFSDISELRDSQVIFSSHSPSILKRIHPKNVRHFRGSDYTEVTEIALPSEDLDVYPYIENAVQAYPELYFSKLVVLGEGPTEEIILRRLFSISGIPLDDSFISVVPLGGRNVNYFWQLLKNLNIPHITLLDLDMGREGGGWGRVKYIVKELLAHENIKEELCFLLEESTLTDAQIDSMHKWTLKTDADLARLHKWVKALEFFNVYFSSPIDLDWSLLNIFPTTYDVVTNLLGDGPRVPANKKDREEYFKTAKNAVLGDSSFNPDLIKAKTDLYYAQYRYLFINNSKPTVHQSFLGEVDIIKFKKNAPPSLKRVVEAARKALDDE